MVKKSAQRTRGTHTPAFKARVALAALCKDQMLAVLGNLKTGLSGSYHGRGFREYEEQYLGAFAYRLNRRFDLRTPPQRLLVAALQCGPHQTARVRLTTDRRELRSGALSRRGKSTGQYSASLHELPLYSQSTSHLISCRWLQLIQPHNYQQDQQ